MLTGANTAIHCIFPKEEPVTIDEAGEIAEKNQGLALGFPHALKLFSVFYLPKQKNHLQNRWFFLFQSANYLSKPT